MTKRKVPVLPPITGEPDCPICIRAAEVGNPYCFMCFLAYKQKHAAKIAYLANLKDGLKVRWR